MKTPDHIRFILITVAAAMALPFVAVVLATSCQRSGDPIQVVVPDKFKGKFCIIEDPREGIETPLVTGGKRVYRIPQKGVFKVKSLDVFCEWHEESYRFEDGKPLKNGNMSGNDSDVKEIEIFDSGIIVGTNYPLPTTIYFVGLKSEYLKNIEDGN